MVIDIRKELFAWLISIKCTFECDEAASTGRKIWLQILITGDGGGGGGRG